MYQTNLGCSLMFPPPMPVQDHPLIPYTQVSENRIAGIGHSRRVH